MFRTLTRLISKRQLASSFCSAKTGIEFKNEPTLYKKLSEEFDGAFYVAPLLKNEELKHVDFEDWKSCINVLKSYGFKEADCFKIIARYLPLLETDPNDIKENLHFWNSAQLGSDSVQFLILSEPQLLAIESDEIQARLPYLISMFKSKKSVVDLLLKSPNVMFDDWDYIIKKIDYILNFRGIEKREILQCTALTKPLDLIQLRFDILEKCGIFKKPIVLSHKKNNYDTSKHQNPPLKCILDYNDEEFAVRVAKISPEEYEVCKDLFNEYEDVGDDEDEDSSEEED